MRTAIYIRRFNHWSFFLSVFCASIFSGTGIGYKPKKKAADQNDFVCRLFMGLVYFVLVCFVFIVLMVTGVGLLCFDRLFQRMPHQYIFISDVQNQALLDSDLGSFFSELSEKTCRNRSQTMSVDFTQQPIRFGCFYLFSLWLFFKWFVMVCFTGDFSFSDKHSESISG